MEQWRQKAKELKKETYALTLACKDSRVSWYVKILAACVIAYALSPIDLIPDFIPVFGATRRFDIVTTGNHVDFKTNSVRYYG